MTEDKKPFQPPMPPGMTPPLPPGQAVPGGDRGAAQSPQQAAASIPPSRSIGVGAVYTESSLLPSEREQLLKMGWVEGDPIPANLPDLLAQGAQLAGSGVELPASSPSAEKRPLSEAQKQAGAAALDQAKEAVAHTRTVSTMQADESVQKAMAAASGAGPADVEVVDDTQDPKYDSGAQKSETGLEPPLQKCPHCDWDLQFRDPIEITDADKQRFLQGILGQTAFQKSFTVFGDAVTVVFRSLTPAELDMCFEQAYLERRRGRFQSPDAYFEVINRYRLSLQLVRIESKDVNHQFPTTIVGWEEKLGPVPPEAEAEQADDRPIKRISEYVFAEVIRTESFNRVLGGLGGEFNSLVAKLEANSQNSDFWSVTK